MWINLILIFHLNINKKYTKIKLNIGMSFHETKENLLKLELSNSENIYSIYKKKFTNALFNMFFYLLKDMKPNLTLECLNILIQYIQLLYFPFNYYVKK